MESISLDLDDILDAQLHRNAVYLLLRDGRRLTLPYTRETVELYWKVKIRNRRRAFGL